MELLFPLVATQSVQYVCWLLVPLLYSYSLSPHCVHPGGGRLAQKHLHSWKERQAPRHMGVCFNYFRVLLTTCTPPPFYFLWVSILKALHKQFVNIF